MEVNYYILMFKGAVLVIGLTKGLLMIIGKGKTRDQALRDFDQQLKDGNLKRGKELPFQR